MSGPRTARAAASAPDPCRLTGFDAMNLAGAVEQLEGARSSIEVIRPRDARMAKRLQRLRDQLTGLIAELRDLGGVQ